MASFLNCGHHSRRQQQSLLLYRRTL
jgi:hypothetical protein